jgi:lipopolysaccharide/colanic/teichoic acid biosynthesis glycosyltransferase
MMLKRVFDIITATLLLLLFSPILLVVSTASWWMLGMPLLFCQRRPGLHGKPFHMYKFRSMTNARDGAGQLLDDRTRLTQYGRFLRATSLDELPELWNVLRGDMSLVGPRPLLEEYLPLYSKEQARRHDVKPGITGWAQVNGRNAVSWDEKFKLDVWYVDNRSMKLDFRILWQTIRAVVSRHGINNDGHATMMPFDGGRSK